MCTLLARKSTTLSLPPYSSPTYSLSCLLCAPIRAPMLQCCVAIAEMPAVVSALPRLALSLFPRTLRIIKDHHQHQHQHHPSVLASARERDAG